MEPESEGLQRTPLRRSCVAHAERRSRYRTYAFLDFDIESQIVTCDLKLRRLACHSIMKFSALGITVPVSLKAYFVELISEMLLEFLHNRTGGQHTEAIMPHLSLTR